MLRRYLINVIAVIVATLVPGVSVSSAWATLAVALVIGIINVTIRPILLLLTLPLNILTLGLFTFVLNAALLKLADLIVPGFRVDGFLPALVGALIISVVHSLLVGSRRDR